MTSRGVGVAIAAGGCWLAARTLGIPELQSAAVAILTLLAAALLWSRVLPSKLALTREVRPMTLGFGEQATVQLTLTNVGRLPTPPLTIHDDVPGTLVDHTPARLRPIRPGHRATATYTLTGRQRGRAVLGPLTVTGRDTFGLAQRRRTLPGTAEVVIYPRVVPLPDGLPMGNATGLGGDGARHRTPSGQDLADIREYVRGDDLRTIHWPSTAHRGKLMVRRSEDLLTPQATVVLDLRPSRHAGHGPDASVEVAIAAAASATDHLAARGRSVTLLDRPVTRPPGPRPAAAWLAHLATTTPEEVDLDALYRQVATGVAGDGALIAIVSTPPDAELRSLVRAGRAASSRLALVIDAGTFQGRTPDPATDEAVSGLLATGWRAAPLRHGDDLAARWRELLTRATRRPTGVG